MPRQTILDPDAEQLRVDQIRPVHRGRGRPRNEDADDPREVMSIGVVQEPAKKGALSKATASGADKATLYARGLVANNGNIAKALASAYNIPEEEAERRMVELHEDVRKHSRSGISLQEMLERHDLTRESRLAVLREALFSRNPGVALKAVEMLDEVDMTAKAARIGSTWDEIVRVAKDRASRKKHAK